MEIKEMKPLFNLVIRELVGSNIYEYKYNEWKVIDENNNRMNFKDIHTTSNEDLEEFESIYEQLEVYKDGPFYFNDGIIVSFTSFNNICFKKHNNRYYLKPFNTETKYDFYNFTLNRIIRSNTHYYIRKGIYVLYNSEYKWLNLTQSQNSHTYIHNKRHNYKDLYKYRSYIKNEYINETKKRLYQMLLIEKVIISEKPISKKLNEDCWNRIRDFIL